ncbi:MAG: AzlD domain-containing protein [Gaiellales bacterium]
MTGWSTVIVASAIAYGLKLAGYLVPVELLTGRRIARVTELLPACLLAALVVVETFTSGNRLVLDARAAGLAAALLALVLRAPFIVVVIVAAGTAAALRAAGWS